MKSPKIILKYFLCIISFSLGAVFLLLVTRCITIRQAYEAVDVPLIVTIAGSFAMATAMEKTGVAAVISDDLRDAFSVSVCFWFFFGFLSKILCNNRNYNIMKTFIRVCFCSYCDVTLTKIF